MKRIMAGPNQDRFSACHDASRTPLAPLPVPNLRDGPPTSLSTAAQASLLEEVVGIVNAHVEHHPERARIPGLSVSIGVGSLPGRTIHAGVTRHGGTEPVSDRTLFRACSMTKTVTTVACLRLVQRGWLSLDAPLVDLLPPGAWPTAGPDANPEAFSRAGVTLRRVLSHTAGFNVYSYDFVDEGLPLPSSEQLLRGIAEPDKALCLIREPGSAWDYSGGGFTLLRPLIESVTGRDAATIIAEEVLRPVGMTQSTFTFDADSRERLVTGHAPEGSPVPFRQIPDLTASGLLTTASDLARFWRACMPGSCRAAGVPELLSPAMLADMLRDQRPNEEGLAWGLGFQLDTHGGSPIYRHAGCRPGHWGHAEGHWQGGLVFVTLCNGQKGDDLFNVLIGKVRRALHRARTTKGLR